MTPLSVGLGVFLLATFASARSNEAATAADPPAAAPRAIAGKAAVRPAAPVIPGPIVAALQEGKYDVARSSLNTLRGDSKDRDERAYLGYLQAIAERLAGQKDAARATLRAALDESPKGPWVPKIRFELAGLELAAGNLAVAEELARTEADRLLSDDRKDRLAEVYHAFARRLLQPDDPVLQPDPKGAWELLNQARDLAKSPMLRAQLLFSMGQASMQAGNFPRAIETLPGVSEGIPLRGRSTGSEVPTWPVPAQGRPAAPGPPHLDGPGPRHRAKEARGATQRRGGDPGQRAGRDSINLRRAQSARRHQPESGSRRTGAVPGSLSRTSQGRDRRLPDRSLLPRPREERAGPRGALQVPQGGRLQGRNRRGAARGGRTGHDGDFPVRPDPPGTAEIHGSDCRLERIPGQLPQRTPECRRPARDPRHPASHRRRSSRSGARYPEARAAWSEFVAQNPLDCPRSRRALPDRRELPDREEVRRCHRRLGPALHQVPQAPSRRPTPSSSPPRCSRSKRATPPRAIERFKKITIEPWRSQAQQRDRGDGVAVADRPDAAPPSAPARRPA